MVTPTLVAALVRVLLLGQKWPVLVLSLQISAELCWWYPLLLGMLSIGRGTPVKLPMPKLPPSQQVQDAVMPDLAQYCVTYVTASSVPC